MAKDRTKGGPVILSLACTFTINWMRDQAMSPIKSSTTLAHSETGYMMKLLSLKMDTKEGLVCSSLKIEEMTKLPEKKNLL